MAAREERRKAALVYGDQVLSSACNFGAAFFVARWVGPSEFGGFSFAFLVYVLFLGIHKAFIADPILIHFSARDGASRRQIARIGFAVELMLGGLGALSLAVFGALLHVAGAELYARTILVMAICLPGAILQDYWRWIALLNNRPAQAIWNDALNGVVQFSLFGLLQQLGYASSVTACAAWGAGSLAGALLGPLQFGLLPDFRNVRGWFAETWDTGKWLLYEYIAQYAANQLYLLVIGVTLASDALGALRAVQNLYGPVQVLAFSAVSYGLRRLSVVYGSLATSGATDTMRRFEEIRRSIRNPLFGFCAVYVLALGLAARPMIGLVYGSSYTQYAFLIPLGGVQWTITVLAMMLTMGIKATRGVRALFLGRLVAAATSLASALGLTYIFSLAGAGIAGILAAAASFTMTSLVYRAIRKRIG